MFTNNPYYQPGMPQGPAFQRPAFQQHPMMYQPQQMPMQQPMMQDGNIQARFVSGREEAVASNVMPGSMFLFHDRANGRVYAKLIDPSTGLADFREYAEIQPNQQQTPQYATLDALDALRNELEQIIEQRISAMQSLRTAPRKAVNNNDE